MKPDNIRHLDRLQCGETPLTNLEEAVIYVRNNGLNKSGRGNKRQQQVHIGLCSDVTGREEGRRLQAAAAATERDPRCQPTTPECPLHTICTPFLPRPSTGFKRGLEFAWQTTAQDAPATERCLQRVLFPLPGTPTRIRSNCGQTGTGEREGGGCMSTKVAPMISWSSSGRSEG